MQDNTTNDIKAPTNPNVIELPFGSEVEGTRNGVFLILTAKAPIYENHEHVPEATRPVPHRVMFMVQRWDGRVGFPGGTCEKGETRLEALKREALEEVNVDLSTYGLETAIELCTHHIVNAKFVVHAYVRDLGEVGTSTLKEISRRAVDADHFLSEGTPFWAHWADYGRGKGKDALLKSSGLASAVREELEAFALRFPD